MPEAHVVKMFLSNAKDHAWFAAAEYNQELRYFAPPYIQPSCNVRIKPSVVDRALFMLDAF